MRGYVPKEYPKWVGDVLVNTAQEELAVRTASEEAEAVARAIENARPPSAAAIRMRRTRNRRRDGKRAIHVDISSIQIEALALAGFVDPAKVDDMAEVARGVGRMVDKIMRPGSHIVSVKL